MVRGRSRPKVPIVERILSLNTINHDSEESQEQMDGTQSQFPTPSLTGAHEATTTWQSYDAMMPLSGFLPNGYQWQPSADDELMLRLFWDNATTLIDPVAQEIRDSPL